MERADDGGVVVRLVVTDTEALISWALDLLDHAEVVPRRGPGCGDGPSEAFVARRFRQMSPGPRHPSRLRRLLAILTWLAQEGEAPIDEVAARFDLTPALSSPSLRWPPAAACRRTRRTSSSRSSSPRRRCRPGVGTTLARPRRLSPGEGLGTRGRGPALLAVPGSDEDGALSRALTKLEGPSADPSVVVELDSPPTSTPCAPPSPG